MVFDATENPLFEARQMFMAGNYDKVITEVNGAVSSSKPTSAAGIAFATEKTELLVLSQLALGNYSAALQLISNTSNARLTVLRKLVEFKMVLHTHPQALIAPRIAEDGSIEEITLSSEVDAALNSLLSVAQVEEKVTLDTLYKVKYAMIALIDVHRYNDALQLGHHCLYTAEQLIMQRASKNTSFDSVIGVLELHALMIEALLRINCIDEAIAQLERMTSINDNIIITRLYTGIVQLHRAQRSASQEIFRDALKTLQSVLFESGQSVLVLNLIAIAQLGCNDAVSAEATLLQASDLRSNDGCTLANLACTSSQLTNGNDVVEKYLSQASHMNTVWSAEFLNVQRKLESAITGFVHKESQ